MNDRKEQSAASKLGIDYGIKLSYAVVDESDAKNKRDLLYSLLCFGCMFDDEFAADPDPILKKYDCLQLPEPQKLDLYALAYTVATLPQNAERAREVKKTWYMLFGYMLIAEPPHDVETYEKLCKLLHTPDVFEDVLQSRYSVYIPATSEDVQAQGASALAMQWYAPYQAYCVERDASGKTRETRACEKLLAAGDFSAVLTRAERLIAAYPDDIHIALVDIAARVSLYGVADEKQRDALLRDTLSLINDYAGVSDSPYFLYYRGLTLLGLMDTAGARDAFTACLEIDPKFELAGLMLKGMDKI